MRSKTILIMLAASLSCAAYSTAAPLDETLRARALYEQGKFKEAEQAYALAVQNDEKSAHQPIERLVQSLLGQARARIADGKPKLAEETLQRASTLSEIAHLPETTLAQIKAALAQCRGNGAAHPGQPEVLPARRFAQMRAALNPVPYYSGRPHALFLQNSMNGRDIAETEYLLRSCVAFGESQWGANSLETAQRRCDLASFYINQKRYDEAAECLQKVSDALPQMTADDRLQAQTSLLDLSIQLAQNHHILQAHQVAKTVLDASNDLITDNAFPDKLSSLAGALIASGDISTGQDYLKKGIALLEKASPQDVRLLNLRLTLAKSYESQGKLNQSAELLELASQKSLGTVDAAQLEQLDLALSTDYLKLGDATRGRQYALKLVEIWTKQQPNRPYDMQPIADLAAKFATEGDLDTAGALAKALFDSPASGRRNNNNDSYLVQALTKLATAYDEMGKPDEAANLYDHFIADRSSQLESWHAVQVLSDACSFELRHGQADKAYTIAQKVAVLAKAPGNQSAQAFYRLPIIAREFISTGHTQLGLNLMKDLAELKQAGGADAYQCLDAYAQLMAIASSAGDNTTAKTALEKAVGLICGQIPQTVASAIPYIKEVCNHLEVVGDYATAGRFIQELTQTARNAQYNSNGKNDFMLQIAGYLQRADLTKEAAAAYASALELQTHAYGPSAIQTAGIMSQYAALLRQLGQGQQAQALAEGADAIQRVYREHQTKARLAAYKPFAPLAETIKLAETLEEIERSPIRQ